MTSLTLLRMNIFSGRHDIIVSYAGVMIGDSPYIFYAYDASLINVSGIGLGFLSKPVTLFGNYFMTSFQWIMQF